MLFSDQSRSGNSSISASLKHPYLSQSSWMSHDQFNTLQNFFVLHLLSFVFHRLFHPKKTVCTSKKRCANQLSVVFTSVLFTSVLFYFHHAVIGLYNKLLTIRREKSAKDRHLALPEKIISKVIVQQPRNLKMLENDCKAGYKSTFLPDNLEKKYTSHYKDPAWYWFFPAPGLTVVPDKNCELRRYHVHPTGMQKALKKAVRQAGIYRRITPL